MKKLLGAGDPSRSLLWMRTTGVLTAILPETEKWGIDAVHGLIPTEQTLRWKPDPLLRLAAMLPPDAERVAAMAKRLRLSKAEAERLALWAASPVPTADMAETALDRMLYAHGKPGLLMRLKLALSSARTAAMTDDAAMLKAAKLSTLLARAERFEKPRFPLAGSDVMALGVAPGPRVGQLLSNLEALWVERNFSLDRDALLAKLGDLVRT